jgi:O-antigen/teichoic acid export membrane protein
VSQRLAESIQRLTNQLSDVLFPAVVDSDASRQAERLRLIFVQGTRLSLATVLPVAVTAAMLAGPLLTAWVGAGAASIVVTRVLIAVVVVRVGTATSMTVLKGAGWHRLLAAANLATAFVNLALSLLLVRRQGLPGVAAGTLLPVSVAACSLIFPAACRRAGVTLRNALLEAVWPAAWPALVMSAWLAAAAPWVRPSLPVVAVHAVLAGLLYFVLFVRWGIPRPERRLYATKAERLIARVRGMEATT